MESNYAFKIDKKNCFGSMSQKLLFWKFYISTFQLAFLINKKERQVKIEFINLQKER